MRLFILFIVCVVNAALVAAGPVVVETRLLRVEGDSLIIETNDGSTALHIAAFFGRHVEQSGIEFERYKAGQTLPGAWLQVGADSDTI